jgi:hypothetical protein
MNRDSGLISFARPENEAWLAESAAVAAAIPEYTPQFEFKIETHRGYDDLFEHRGEGQPTPWDSLLTLCKARGRVMLIAEGGFGKTSIVGRLYKMAVASGWWPVMVDLRTWGATVAERWNEAEGRVARMELLLSSVGQPRTNELSLLAAPDGEPRIVFVDGLNEVDSLVAQELLTALDEFAARNPLASVLVTDRLVRRQVRSDRWVLAAIAPLSDEEVAKHVGGQVHGNALLKTAFFLDMAAKSTVDSSSGPSAIKGYLEGHTGLDAAGIDRASRAAFEAYMSAASSDRSSRAFDLEPFREVASAHTAEQLQQTVLVVGGDGTAYFRHHLFHDYLASLWLSGHPELWQPKVFDGVTFRAGSFDALALALEQLAAPAHADAFLYSVYDWNFYAVSYALWKAESQGASAVSKDAKEVLLTLLSEKTWDPLLATRKRVLDGLHFFRDEPVLRLLSAASLSELVQIVAKDDSIGSMRPEWRNLFTTAPDTEVPDDLVEQINELEPVIGWTVANVLRRVQLTDAQEARLRELGKNGSDVVRWRIAHVFGAHPSSANVTCLFTRLADTYVWVRYGSVRSLVESASRSAELRDEIVDRLLNRLPEIIESRELLAELEKALVLADPPKNWAAAIEPLLDALWAKAADYEEQERWLRLAQEVQRGSD